MIIRNAPDKHQTSNIKHRIQLTRYPTPLLSEVEVSDLYHHSRFFLPTPVFRLHFHISCCIGRGRGSGPGGWSAGRSFAVTMVFAWPQEQILLPADRRWGFISIEEIAFP